VSVQRCDCVDGRCGHEYADECVLPLRDYGSALEALNAELEAECKKLRRKMRERDEEHAAEIERWQGLYDMATGNDDAIAVLSAKLEAAETRAKEAEKNYRWMVERAADEKLDGYRELGARAAEAERQRDEALAQVARLRWAVREYADTSLLDDAEEGRCDCDAETEQCEFCGLREALLAAHPEPAEQAATDEEPGEGRS